MAIKRNSPAQTGTRRSAIIIPFPGSRRFRNRPIDTLSAEWADGLPCGMEIAAKISADVQTRRTR